MKNTSSPGRPRQVEFNPRKQAAQPGHVPTSTDVHPWMDSAACLNMFGWIEADPRSCRKVCAGCPVLAECRERTLRMSPLPSDGIWAGMDPGQIRQAAPQVTVVQVSPRPVGVTTVDCGSQAGYARHDRAGEKPCAACKDAVNRLRRERARQRREAS